MHRQAFQLWLDKQSFDNLKALAHELFQCLGYDTEDLADANQNALMAQLEQLYSSEEKMIELYHSLHDFEKKVIQLFIFYMPGDMVSHRQFEQLVERYDKSTAVTLYRLALVQLRRKGIIQTYQLQWGELAYYLQESFSRFAYTALIRKAELEELTPSNTKHAEHVAEPPFILKGIVHCLEIMHKLPKKDKQLTKQGILKHKVIEQLEKCIEDLNLSFEGFDPVAIQEEKYPPALAILLDFLSYQGLIIKVNDELTLDHAAIKAFLAQTNQAIVRAFCDYLLRNIKPRDVYLKRFWQDLGYVLRQNVYAWFSILDWAMLWEEKYDLPPVEQLSASILDALSILQQFGLIELQKNEGHDAWRMIYLEDTPMQLWIQEDQECFCPGFISLAQLMVLLKGMTICQWDQMLVLRFDVQKLQHLDEQQELAEWLEQIADFSGMQVEELEMQLQLYEQRNQVTLQQMLVLHFQNATAISLTKEWLELQGVAFIQPHASYLLIDPSLEENLISWLEERGIALKREQKAQLIGAIDTALSDSEGVELQFVHRAPLQQLPRAVTDFPELEEAIPAWGQLPEMWKKQMVTYHTKVKRDLVTKAIEGQLYLKVELPTGEMCQILPLEISSNQGKDMIYSQEITGEQRKFPLEDLERMQLLFPFLD